MPEPTDPRTVKAGGEGAARAAYEAGELEALATAPAAPYVEEPRFYCDPCVNPYRGELYGHLYTTGTREDLLEFGRKIGLKPEWLQHKDTTDFHFDINKAKREQAIAAGAIPAAASTCFRACVLTRRKAHGEKPGTRSKLVTDARLPRTEHEDAADKEAAQLKAALAGS